MGLNDDVEYLYRKEGRGLGDLSSRLDLNVKFGNFNFSDTIVKLLALKDGDRILDVGCGTGKHLEEFKGKFDIEAHGVDPSVTEEREGDVVIKKAGAEKIPYPDDFFDKLMCNYAMYYVVDWKGALSEMQRVVKPGGRILICGPGVGNNANLYEVHRKVVGDISEIDVRGSKFMEGMLIPFIVESGLSFSSQLYSNKISYPTAEDFVEYYGSTSLFRMTSKGKDADEIIRGIREEVKAVYDRNECFFNYKKVRAVVVYN